MADNTILNPGTGGDTIASDDIAGVKYQIVKLAFGPLDTATLVTAAVGVPVTGTFWQATQPVSGTVTANAGTGTLAVSLATLPALTTGAAVIGAVTQSGTWNIGSITSDDTNRTNSTSIPSTNTGDDVSGTRAKGRVDAFDAATRVTGSELP